MMQRPWDRAQPDEWLPRSLRLCWGGDGGGGFGGDGGGFASTGGGDWGSAGSFDASSFNAGGDLSAWAGTAYDASTAGTGAGQGGDWGSFGATSYAGLNAPNPTFADVAGPNPGVTTGGGDWGSAGTFSAEGMGGGPGGGLYGGGGGGGGLFGGYEGGAFGGGGGGYTGGGGGRSGGGEGRSGGGEAGGGRSSAPSVTSPYADDTGPAGRGESEVSSPYADDTGPTGRGEQDTVGPAPEAAPAALSDFGKPAEAAPDAEAPSSEAAPSRSEDAPSRSDDAPSRAGSDEGRSAFGPESVTSQEGRQALSDLTQSALAPQGPDWGSVFEAPTDPAYQNDRGPGPMGPLAEPGPFESLTSDIPGVTTPAWAQDFGKSITDINTWLSPLNQQTFNEITNLPSTINQALNPSVPMMLQAPSTMDLQAAGEQGKAGQPTDLSSQLGIESVGAPDTTDWGSVFEGAAPPAQDLATQLGAQDIDATDWGSVFEGATPDPGAYDPTADQAAYDFGGLGQPYGQTDFGGWADTPADTTMESGQPTAQMSTDTTATPGGDPALSGASVAAPGQLGEPGAAPGAPQGGWDFGGWADTGAPGAPGEPGTPGAAPGQPGQIGSIDPGVSPDAIANAASNAALDVDAPPAAGDAASQAAQAAAQAGQSLANVTDAARDAALANGATPEQADAIAAAVYNAAVSKAENEVGTTPGAPPAAPTTPTTQTPPSLVEMAQPGATRSESSIPGGRTTDFNYPTSSTPPPDPAQHGEGEPGGEGNPDQPSTVPATPLAAPEPGGVTAADRAARGPNAQPEPQQVQSARQYLLSTANPGDTMNRQGPDVAIARLEPNFAVRLAGAIREARANGLPNASVFSAFRAPAFGANPGYAAVSQHGRGVAVDMSGIGRPGSREAQLWYQIATRNGLFNPYGPNHRAEWNHYQAVPQTGRQTADRLGPNPRTPPDNMVPTWARVGVRPVEDIPRPPADIPNVRTAQPSAQAPRGLDPGAQQYGVTASPIMIGFKGKGGVFDEQAFNDHAASLGYRGIVANTLQEARAIIDQAAGKVGLYGFSAGANTAHGLLGEKGVKDKVDRVVTVAPFHGSQTQNFKGTNWDNFPDYSSRGIAPQGQGFDIQTRSHSKEAQREAATGQAAPADTQIAGGARGIGSDRSNIPWGEPPAEVTALPPPEAPLPPDVPVTRPPADIPIDIPSQAPAPFMTPPARGQLDRAVQTQNALNIIKDSTAKLTTTSGQAEFNAAGVVAAKGLAAAGVPLAMARSLMTDSAYKGAEKVGYGPSATLWGIYKGAIDSGINAALQGYHPAAPGPVQGPYGFQPDAPAPAPEAATPGKQGSLLDFLNMFNPISTAEARGAGGRSQASQLQAPRADPGTIQSRLADARANVIDDLQTNQGLRNTLDLIVTGEVGSQGKTAVLGFLETAMNKVAAEASAQGRAPTGRDLLNYLNDRSYFPDTWGKIESGKIKGGALTDDLIGAIAAGSNITKGSTGNSSATSPGSRFGGNPTNATIGREHYGVENYAHHAAWYNALGAPPAGRGIGSDYAAGPYDAPAVGAMPPADAPLGMRGLAKGGRVDDDEPVVVGEQGPEVFVPDKPGTVWPHIPQPGKAGKTGRNIDRWPKIPAPEYPGRYGGVEREMLRQTREAQYAVPTLMDMIDSGRLRLNAANWNRMITDPSLIALGRSRMDDRREGLDPGAEQYGAFIPAPAPAAEPPDPTNPMAQALGYGSIARRPLHIGRQSY